MTQEKEYNAYVTCSHCHGLKAKSDTVEVDGKTLCKGTCYEIHAGRSMPFRRPALLWWSESG